MSDADASGPPPMSYQDLRRMVECAGSYRGEEAWIVIKKGKWHVKTSRPDPGKWDAVIPFQNPAAIRPVVKFAEIGVGGGRNVNLLKLKKKTGDLLTEEGPADAVFWSAAAVEKFLVPYYASVYGNQAIDVLQKLIDLLGTRQREANGPEVFAVAHMPKSEYVQVDEHSLAVLMVDPGANSEPYAVPLSQFSPMPPNE